MTVGGSNAAIPVLDAVRDRSAEAGFLAALPVILEDVLAQAGVEELIAAFCEGGEELVDRVSLTFQNFDPRLLAGRVYDQPSAALVEPRTLSLVDLRSDGIRVHVPVSFAGVTLGELVADTGPGGWITAQQRDQLRRYADLVASALYGRLERDELRRAALTDELTGLANRRALDVELERIWSQRGRVSLILLDLDGLKEINDALGYDQGDQLICALARSISGAVRDRHLAARMGGDEFLVLLPDATAKQARKLAKRIGRRFSAEPLHPGVAALSSGVSIGIVRSRRSETPRHLVRRAARSMQTNKRRRRSDRPRSTRSITSGVQPAGSASRRPAVSGSA
jgi:diguanylate cyclase (GGDEF)-like protein